MHCKVKTLSEMHYSKYLLPKRKKKKGGRLMNKKSIRDGGYYRAWGA